MALYKKVDLIEENQHDIWIQHIRIVLDQLKKPRHQICRRPVIYIYINGKPKHVKSHVALYKSRPDWTKPMLYLDSAYQNCPRSAKKT